jgi:radical SAM-linked protein
MNEAAEIKIKVTYTKFKPACYIAHLDTIDAISKALRRLRLPYLVTEGCHTRPKISFGAPLPLGHASRCEQFVLSLSEKINTDWLQNQLSIQLPVGMDILKVESPCPLQAKGANGDEVKYQFGFKTLETARQAAEFLANPKTAFEAFSKGKSRSYQLGNAVKSSKSYEAQGQYVLEIDFIQGQPAVPSVSKIVTALASYLSDKKDDLVKIERLALQKL